MQLASLTDKEPTLHVSEVFESIQGEGATAGQPCVFLRLAGCNLRCHFCDTKYTWDWKNFDRKKESKPTSIAQLSAQLAAAPRVVITGGEPLLQQRVLAELLGRLPAEIPLEIETNGTVKPSAVLLARVNQWNVSPKLSDSGDTEGVRIVPSALKVLRDTGRAFLKCVVSSTEHVAEVSELAARLNWPMERVLLQAQAQTRSELQVLGPQVAGWCQMIGARYSPRLHVELWDSKRGV